MSLLSRSRVAAVGAAAAVTCATIAVATPAYASLPQRIICKKGSDYAEFHIYFTLLKNHKRHIKYITYKIKKRYSPARNKNNISFKDFGNTPPTEWANRDNGKGDGITHHLLKRNGKDISYTRHQQSMYMYVTFDHPKGDPSCSSGPVYW